MDLTPLIARLPAGTVSTHPGELSTRARDRWALALLRETRGDRVPPPSAVVFPRTTDDVQTVLAWATETRTPVVARGAGSGLSGGAEALNRGVVLDLSKMDRILGVDEISQTVEVQAGIRGDELEADLAGRGLTTGHHLASLAVSTVGGWVATDAAGHASPGYGSVADSVVGLTVVLADGSILRRRTWPSGTGAQLTRLFAGSEGVLGVITEVTLALSRAPASHAWEVLRPNSFEAGAALVRELVQRPFHPLIACLLDPAEAASAFDGSVSQRPVAIVGFDAGAPGLDAVREELRRVARELGARPLDPQLGDRWWFGRFDRVSSYDRVMGEQRASGPGVVVDTVEATAVWRRIPRLYQAVRGALLEHATAVSCRLARAHPAGAALQFTFTVSEGDDWDAEPAYRQAWDDAAGACLNAGGSLTGNGVGVLRLPFVTSEIGPQAVRALRSIKHALDPANILNPGKLLPPA